MKTVLLLSLLIATLAVPAIAARDRHPVRALKGMVFFFVVFITVYAIHVTFIHPRFFVPHR